MFRPNTFEIGGGICALLGFVVHVSQDNSRSVNGVVVQHSHSDLAGVILGGLAIVLAGRAVWDLYHSRILPSGSKGQHIALAAVIAVVGFYHLASGTGLL